MSTISRFAIFGKLIALEASGGIFAGLITSMIDNADAC